MSIWMIVQVVFNIFIALFVYVFWIKLRKPPKDDPRLSRGLQLLQSKISVLEDLSDKTEVQVEQLNALMEKKIKQVQAALAEADAKMRNVEESIQRNREMTKIFQEQIPHDEIVKRQNTVKYIKAAKMANTGSSVEEIAEVVDLPLGEIELIAKLNKDNLVFDDESLPEWAKEDSEIMNADDWQLADKDFRTPDLSNALNYEKKQYDSLQKLGEEFRRACTDYELQSAEEPTPSQIVETAKAVSQKVADMGSDLAESIATKMQKSMERISENIESKLKTELSDEEEELAESDSTHEHEPSFSKRTSEPPKNPIPRNLKLNNDETPKAEPSLTLEAVSEIDSSAEALAKMQKNRRLELSHPEYQEVKKVEFPKTQLDINKTLG
ncbi:MAG: DUF2802 domain-containing protein [Bdellovibrionales bacterium]|nr:DUF2802 domain-containing protein [Bdellovibrionales bacterium]